MSLVLNLPSGLPRTLRSSNNLYEGIKGFCPAPAGTAENVGVEFETGRMSPLIAAPFNPLAGYGLTCCKGLTLCEGIYEVG